MKTAAVKATETGFPGKRRPADAGRLFLVRAQPNARVSVYVSPRNTTVPWRFRDRFAGFRGAADDLPAAGPQDPDTLLAALQ